MNANFVSEQPKGTIQSDVSTKILMNHLNSFTQNDLQALMLDYTEDSIFVTQDTTYTGIVEIKEFFATLMAHFPKEKSKFELDKLVVKDELGFIVWHATTPSVNVPFGSDTFIIKDGKIRQQTFVGKINYIN